MASKALISLLFVIFFIVVVSSESNDDDSYYTSVPSSHKKSKMTYLHFYLHEQVSGDNATETAVAFGGNNTVNSAIPFGLTAVFDYLMTETNESSSTQVGKAQGLLSVSSMSENSVTMVCNFLFTEGKYNGSTLAVLAQNNLYLKERELPIIGGTGLFRYARGYIKTNTVYSSSSYYIFDWKLYFYYSY
jgi:hypothetical protein